MTVCTEKGYELPFGYVFDASALPIDDEGHLFFQEGECDENGKQGLHTAYGVVDVGLGMTTSVAVQMAEYKNDVLQNIEQFNLDDAETCLKIAGFDEHQNPQGKYYSKKGDLIYNGRYDGSQFTGHIVTKRSGFYEDKTVHLGIVTHYNIKRQDTNGKYEEHAVLKPDGSFQDLWFNVNGRHEIHVRNGQKLSKPEISTPSSRRKHVITTCLALAATLVLWYGVEKIMKQGGGFENRASSIVRE